MTSQITFSFRRPPFSTLQMHYSRLSYLFQKVSSILLRESSFYLRIFPFPHYRGSFLHLSFYFTPFLYFPSQPTISYQLSLSTLLNPPRLFPSGPDVHTPFRHAFQTHTNSYSSSFPTLASSADVFTRRHGPKRCLKVARCCRIHATLTLSLTGWLVYASRLCILFFYICLF